MQILSDYNYILSKLKCRLHEIVVLLLINDKVSTGPCHQQTLGMILEATQRFSKVISLC